jgi:peptidoglycan/xylan/chitin deacetylase (PgdA/CDA1 family)
MLLNSKNVVLMYHAVDSEYEPSGFEKTGDIVYVVDKKDFKEQISFLLENNVQVASFKEIYGKKDKDNEGEDDISILLTFDDGHLSNFNIAFPILLQARIDAIFFITTDWIGQKDFMNENMIRNLCDSGMTIGSHGKSHKFLSDLKDEQIYYELKSSKDRLEDIIQRNILCLSYPGGRYNDRVVNIAREIGYLFIFDSTPTVNNEIGELKTIGRFAIKRSHNLDYFTLIVSGYISRWANAEHNVLSLLKSLFGNKNYEKIRSIILGSNE